MSVMTIQQILDSFDKEASKLFNKVLGGLAPEDELIRKQIPANLLRFAEGDTAAIGVVSDIRKDRDDEVLMSEGMDDSNYSGIVLWQHDYWREGIPHATNNWLRKEPKVKPHSIIGRTEYLVDLSQLGKDVYEYRKAKHPLGQSVGFRAVESVRQGDTGFDDVFDEWLPRVKAMLKEKGLKPTKTEFTAPRRFFTKWDLWEYSDVYIGSNVDALQIAVKSGIISNDEARQLVDFKAEPKPEEVDGMLELLKRIEAVEDGLAELEAKNAPPALDLEGLWSAPLAPIVDTRNEGVDFGKMWDSE